GCPGRPRGRRARGAPRVPGPATPRGPGRRPRSHRRPGPSHPHVQPPERRRPGQARGAHRARLGGAGEPAARGGIGRRVRGGIPTWARGDGDQRARPLRRGGGRDRRGDRRHRRPGPTRPGATRRAVVPARRPSVVGALGPAPPHRGDGPSRRPRRHRPRVDRRRHRLPAAGGRRGLAGHAVAPAVVATGRGRTHL
ncbi:MAG: Protein of unknown function DUF664, partial [uncultured Acidimicrobiales bacterium]